MNMHCEKQENGTVVCTFDYYNSAYTLNTDVIGSHSNGWIIKADVVEDYYEWVNYFEAKKGNNWVYGDFESEVKASSYAALGDFLDNFKPEEWDYQDI